jgi:hypothetical protein
VYYTEAGGLALSAVTQGHNHQLLKSCHWLNVSCSALPLLLLLLLLLLPGAPPGPSEEALARKLLELVKATASNDAAGERS